MKIKCDDKDLSTPQDQLKPAVSRELKDHKMFYIIGSVLWFLLISISLVKHFLWLETLMREKLMKARMVYFIHSRFFYQYTHL